MSGGQNAERKLATDAAKTTAQEMISLIADELGPVLQKFETKAIFLDDPQQFDGPLAVNYDTEYYPATKAAIDKLQTELKELSDWLNTNLGNILSAGGG
jgi:hypothetical protein